MLAASRKHVHAIASSITVTLLLTASMCLGQSRQGNVLANVPFQFMVANHTLPPGRYIVTPVGETNLQIYANGQGVIFQTHNVAGKASEGTGKLVFHRYGSTYILSEVWMAGKGTGSRLFPSQAEKELARRSENEIAVLRAIPAGRCCGQDGLDISSSR